jgi:peptide chain release factor 2
MYFRYAENKGFTVLVNDYQSGGEAGIKSATLSISGDYAFGLLKAERGVHRLVRISPFDASGRRHTSFASVNVVPEVDDTIDIEIKDNDLKIDTFRSSGAGGQSVNTTDSAVRITHLPTNMVVSCQNERSQIKNREQALKILKGKLYQRELEKQQEALNAERNSDTSNAFGSQIRSYVLHPYTMVKDHRTNEEMGNTTKVLDGEIDPFIRAYLRLLTKEARANENIT